MTVLSHHDPRTQGAILHRQPIVHPDRSVFGYAVRAEVRDAHGGLAPEDMVEERLDKAYATLDPATIAGDRPLMVRATTDLLLGLVPTPVAAAGIALELPLRLASLPDTAQRLVELRSLGYGLALGDYSGTPAQDVLLPLVDLVKVHTGRAPEKLSGLIAQAHGAGVRVVGERVATSESIAVALDLGIDLLQGPMFERRPVGTGREFLAGELQCLNLVRLLSQETPDHEAVVHTVESDPELCMRVLHVVNASASGVRRHVDSVRQAVVLLGPRQLTALAMASLVNARPATVGTLWSVLARALTCGMLSGTGAGYTVGMLSAVAAQLHVSVEALVQRAGVSDDIAAALRDQTGPYGPVLAAVLAHEENDHEAVAATGLEPWDVAHAYLAAVPQAFTTASELAVAARS
ncbi:EAL and HDOD domain-containing protein [Cellulomonas fengjieae]|uniref:HDOD domain-containing protein n=1 Tax=Cellulomonas fengjieae TaxID=2819978 RepID=A0ABS3SGT7_9CELL|nr:HDOD domain-containing protein [Cellulomonas fengjieae]MBO3084953.1 HDOD domain-containing protein [Cellulomonas fengjieae]QVI66447.1 HDOD domain-containing protein [Cellulomonas fengjieae]